MPFRYSLNSLILGSPRTTHMRIGKDIPAELRAVFMQAVLLYYWEGMNNGYFYEGIRRDPSSGYQNSVWERGYVDTSGGSPHISVISRTVLVVGGNPLSNFRDGTYLYTGNIEGTNDRANLQIGEWGALTFSGTGQSGGYMSAGQDTYISLPSMQIVNSDDLGTGGSGTGTGDYSWTNTTYGTSTSAGTYFSTSLTFVAPASGKGLIVMQSQLLNTVATSQTFLSPQVREGSTVGSGTIVAAASDTEAMVSGFTSANPGQSFVSGQRFVTNLTQGDTYNVQLLHRVNANTGRTLMKKMFWIPSF